MIPLDIMDILRSLLHPVIILDGVDVGASFSDQLEEFAPAGVVQFQGFPVLDLVAVVLSELVAVDEGVEVDVVVVVGVDEGGV